MALSLNRTPAPETYYARRRRPPPIIITESCVNMVAAGPSSTSAFGATTSHSHRPLVQGVPNLTHPAPRRIAARPMHAGVNGGVAVPAKRGFISSVPMRRTMASMGMSRRAAVPSAAPMGRSPAPAVLAVSSISMSASSVTLYRAGGVAMERAPSSYGVDGNPYRPRTLPPAAPAAAPAPSPPAMAQLPLSPERSYDTMPARLSSTLSPHLRHRHSHTELSRRRRAPLPFDVS